MAAGVHGFWAAPETWSTTAQSPYTLLSWNTDGNAWTSVAKQRFPMLALPRFYRFENAPLPRSAAPLVYGALRETNWPSLYGSIDPYEDFAETFVLYVHTRILKRPFRVDVYLGPRKLTEYRSCLDTGRCPPKSAFIERLLTTLTDMALRATPKHESANRPVSYPHPLPSPAGKARGGGR